MTSLESTGKNIEEATQIALEQLGVTEDDVDVEIIDEGSRGFLGLGQTAAKVRVNVKQTNGEPTKAEVVRESKPIKPAAAPEAAQATPTVRQAEAPTESLSEEIVREVGDSAVEILQHMLDGIGSGGTAVLGRIEGDHVNIEIEGGDSAILIGKHGQTIDSMQYLVNVIVNRHSHGRVRVALDTEGYRARREEALRNQALYLADKVKQTGQEAVLDALHANERRIIHTVLADDPDVYTYSEGQDPERHIVISPKK